MSKVREKGAQATETSLERTRGCSVGHVSFAMQTLTFVEETLESGRPS